MTASLRLESLSIRARHDVLVDDVWLELVAGRAFTLLGESGSGKSLLAQALLGTLPPSLAATGRIQVLGHTTDIADRAARRPLWGHMMALLPQEPWLALDPTMRVRRQIGETHTLVGGQRAPEAAARTERDLRAAGIDASVDPWPHVLSGGMAQRVAFAITRAGGAPVLIVDEPTKGLDAPLRDALVERLQEVLVQGGSVLTITHDVHVARAMGGEAAVMLEGRVVERGPARDVLTRPTDAYTRRLLAAAPEAWPTRAPSLRSARSLVSLDRVSKAFGHRTLFDQVTLDIARGDRVVFTGPSGSGKSTLGNILLGLIPPDTGRVTRAADVAPFGFQKLYQDPVAAFPPRATLGQTLDDLVRRHRLPPADRDRLLTHLGLATGILERRPQDISGGELQRLALVRVLLMNPVLIFADEPTSRLDPMTQQVSMDLLLDSADATGAALILVTHDPDIARATGGRMVTIGGA